MVLSHAPNSRRPDVKETASDWTSSFRKASALRTAKKQWQIAICLVAGAFLLPNGLAVHTQAQTEQPKVSAEIAPETASVATDHTTETPVSAVTNISPLPANDSTVATASTREPEATSTATTNSSAVAPSSSSSPSANTVPSQPIVAPVSSASPVKQPVLHIQAIVAGKTRRGEIAVTPKMTVGQALAAMGISLAVLDRVMPDASALARDGLTIRVTRVSHDIEKRRVAIPAELRYKPTTAIKAGTKQQIQSPKSGAMEISERIWRVDGKITKREFVSQHVAVAPQHRIIALGVLSHLMPKAIKPNNRYAMAQPTSRGMGGWGDRLRSQRKLQTPKLPPANPDHFKPVKSIDVVATGYAAGRAGGAISSRTCTGVRCTYGAVAVDPRLIPLGTKMYIEGYGYGFACDIGGAIKGKHIDLAFNSASAAFAHGRKKTRVWILAPDS